jgi:hypothetical protein
MTRFVASVRINFWHILLEYVASSLLSAVDVLQMVVSWHKLIWSRFCGTGLTELWLLLGLSADRMRPEDVGLSSDMPFFRTRDVAQRNPTITHTTIYKSENFSVSASVKTSTFKLNCSMG